MPQLVFENFKVLMRNQKEVIIGRYSKTLGDICIEGPTEYSAQVGMLSKQDE